MAYKAVLFDVGGVVAGSPLLGIQKYEKAHSIPDQYINWAIFKSGKQGGFQRVERGEMLVGREFYQAFQADVRNPAWVQGFVAKEATKGRHVEAQDILNGIKNISGEELWHWMMRESMTLDPWMMAAIRTLKRHGVKVAALTNNFKSESTNPEHPPHELEKEFDVFLESAVLGMRKPSPEIFMYSMDVLGVTPAETIFLDDIGSNLASAKALGITVIRVYIGKTRQAVEELSRLIQIPLIDTSQL
jgi:epoxide hydrolase-like predicted phosphatase